MTAAAQDRLLIIDFGSQVTQLIARRVRESGVYCEIVPYQKADAALDQFKPQAVILSGSPASTTWENAPRAPDRLFSMGLPVLGICYGEQTMCAQLGGRVETSSHREFGRAEIEIVAASPLFDGLAAVGEKETVWMSHGDKIAAIPPGFAVIARTPAAPYAAIADEARRFYGVQFHAEVVHTPRGAKIISNFVHAIAGLKSQWTMKAFRDAEIARIRAQVGKDKVVCGLSGGVDSTALVAIAKRLFGADVHGYTIMNRDKRYEERDMVERTVAHLGIRHTPVPPETAGFLDKLDMLVAQHDAPVITQAYYAQWILLDHIHRDGYRIALSGSAADEIFSGYYDHHLFYLAAMRADPSRYASALAEWQNTVLPEILNPGFKNPDRFVADPLDRSHLYEDVPVFKGYLTGAFNEPFDEDAYSPIMLRNRMLNEMFHEAVPPILYQDDLNAMYFSIENRSPYLDRDLFEWSLTVPQRHLVKDGRAKALLRAAVADLAPHEVLFNPRKTGFNVPIRDLVDTADPATRARILSDSPVWDLVDRAKIAGFLEKPALDNAESKFLFYLLSAKSFLEQPR